MQLIGKEKFQSLLIRQTNILLASSLGILIFCSGCGSNNFRSFEYGGGESNLPSSSSSSSNDTPVALGNTGQFQKGFNEIEAEAANEIQSQLIIQNGHVGYSKKGSYLSFYLDFGSESARSLRLVLAAPADSKRGIEMRIDGLSGELIGTIDVKSTTSWSNYVNQIIDLQKPISGKIKIYFVFTDDNVADLDKIQFSTAITAAETMPVNIQAPTSSTFNSLDLILADMTQPPNANGRGNNYPAVAFSGNYQQALKLAPKYARNIDQVMAWCWAFRTAEHNNLSNTGVQMRNVDLYAYRGEPGKGRWVTLGLGRPGTSTFVHGEDSSGNFLGEWTTAQIVDQDTVLVRPGVVPSGARQTRNNSMELWNSWVNGDTISWANEITAVFASCQMRMVSLDGTGNYNGASYAGQIGFDLWARGAALDLYNKTGNYLVPGQTQFWGTNGRMKKITTEWQTFNSFTMKPSDTNWSDLPAWFVRGEEPLNNLNVWGQGASNPYLEPPYTWTEKQLRDNPPPLR